MKVFCITGKSFPHKTYLRSIGCIWEPEQKQWLLPSEKMTREIQDQIVALGLAISELRDPPERFNSNLSKSDSGEWYYGESSPFAARFGTSKKFINRGRTDRSEY
jgi:hypothetical protein